MGRCTIDSFGPYIATYNSMPLLAACYLTPCICYDS